MGERFTKKNNIRILSEFSIDIAGWKTGVYLINVVNLEGSIFSQNFNCKIVINSVI